MGLNCIIVPWTLMDSVSLRLRTGWSRISAEMSMLTLIKNLRFGMLSRGTGGADSTKCRVSGILNLLNRIRAITRGVIVMDRT